MLPKTACSYEMDYITIQKMIRTLFNKLGLFLSLCLTCTGLAGTVYVIMMGVVPSHNPMGHSKEYEQGWNLFFSIFLGVPSLFAFFCGLILLFLFVKSSRKRQYNSQGKKISAKQEFSGGEEDVTDTKTL